MRVCSTRACKRAGTPGNRYQPASCWLRVRHMCILANSRLHVMNGAPVPSHSSIIARRLRIAAGPSAVLQKVTFSCTKLELPRRLGPEAWRNPCAPRGIGCPCSCVAKRSSAMCPGGRASSKRMLALGTSPRPSITWTAGSAWSTSHRRSSNRLGRDPWCVALGPASIAGTTWVSWRWRALPTGRSMQSWLTVVR